MRPHLSTRLMASHSTPTLLLYKTSYPRLNLHRLFYAIFRFRHCLPLIYNLVTSPTIYHKNANAKTPCCRHSFFDHAYLIPHPLYLEQYSISASLASCTKSLAYSAYLLRDKKTTPESNRLHQALFYLVSSVRLFRHHPLPCSHYPRWGIIPFV